MVCPPIETGDAAEQVAAALQSLPVLERRVVELHHCQDKTITQTAQELRIGRPRASRLHARALVTLRAAVKNATSQTIGPRIVSNRLSRRKALVILWS